MSRKCTTWCNKRNKCDLVKFYLQEYAMVVKGEDASTNNHTARVLYADKILRGEANVFEFALALTTTPTIKHKLKNDEGVNSDIAAGVAEIFNAFTGGE